MTGHSHTTIPWGYRAAFYGINVLFIEVMVMALWEFYHSQDLKLVGYSSVWSLLLYGILFVVIEHLYFFLKDRGYRAYLRVLIYGGICLAIELMFGLVLRFFGALSWDYSSYKLVTYHFMGLVALECVPLWSLGCFFLEIQADFIVNRLAYSTKPAVKQHSEWPWWTVVYNSMCRLE